MKKILVITLVGLLLVGGTFGQTKFVPHKKGDKAMLFEFSGLGFLFADTYNGGFGFKRFLNEKTAVRGSFALSNAKETISWGPENYPDGWIGEDGSDKTFTFGIQLAGEVHSNKGKVDPYYGAGIGFDMVRTKFIDTAAGSQGSSLTATEIKNNFGDGARTGFGAFALLGVEYAINSVLSLAAEYHLGFNMASQPDMVVTDASGVETSYSGGKYSFFGITSVGILTLAIYL